MIACGTCMAFHTDVSSKIKWTNFEIWNVSKLEGDTSKTIYMNNNVATWRFDLSKHELSFQFYNEENDSKKVIMNTKESPVDVKESSLVVCVSQDEMDRYIRNFNEFFDNPGDEVEVFSQEIYHRLKSRL